MPKPNLILLGLAGTACPAFTAAVDYLVQACAFERYTIAKPLMTMLEGFFVETFVDIEHATHPQLAGRPIERLGGKVNAAGMLHALRHYWAPKVDAGLLTRAAELSLGLHDEPGVAPVHDRIVITDIDTLAQADWLRSKGGQLVLLTQSHAESTGWDQHIELPPVLNNHTESELFAALEALVAQAEARAA